MKSSASSARQPGGVRILLLGAVTALSCRFDPAYRDVSEPFVTSCIPGSRFCSGSALARCNDDGVTQTVQDDCGARGLACAPTLTACTACAPAASRCNAQTVEVCDAQGGAFSPREMCASAKGIACRQGACLNLCNKASEDHSNIGCEYWAADLDNAVVSPSLNAAAQQYAVVVSNVDPDLPATVTVEEDDALPDTPAKIRVVGVATIAPRNLEVFRLGPREVDGSADGSFNTGTGTALTRHAFRVTSNIPIVAYQFNPLENVNVFSNDASQLLPVSALGGGEGHTYVVAGWPQTIATSTISSQNFGQDLRAFLAILATRPDTKVHVKTTARIIPGGPFPNGLPAGAEADVVLQPFDVLNLETGDFNADFTGSLIDASQPVAVFPGSEASDAPRFDDLANRFCCADHLEQQATPIRAVGKSYAIARMPNRTRVVMGAGGAIGQVDEPEYYRTVATRPGVTHIKTSLPAPNDAFDLTGEGGDRILTAHQDFMITGSQAFILADVQASQEAAGVVRGLPGGDPSLVFVAPIEQWRNDYVLLTPDRYSFDFLVISAPAKAQVFIDRVAVDAKECESAKIPDGTADPAYVAYRCQLSFPVIDPNKTTDNVAPGRQNDGVHHVQSDVPVGVIVYGFDAFVSYAYAGGTQLTEINLR